MPGELLNLLLRRKSAVEENGQSWESSPEDSRADAKHLQGLDFTGPSREEWLKTVDDSPEEDTLPETLAANLETRGAQPSHAPRCLDDEDAAKLKTLALSLAQLQERCEAERESLSGEREELARRETAFQKAQLDLEAERQQQQQAEQARKEYPPPEWLKNVKGTMNIAVTGNSGVGKSLLINRLRKVRPGAQGWAAVGVREQTLEATKYQFPNEKRVRLWDLPGAGTEKFPSETYIQCMGLRYFDRVIIVSAGRFTSTEVALKAELEARKVPFLMVRTKVDIDVWNNYEDNKLREQDTLGQIREDFKQNGITDAFLVSLRDPERFDMPQLERTLFPNVRRNVLDPDAPSFQFGADTWNDAWAMPVVYSEALAGIQGRWHDSYGCTYQVQGEQAHVSLQTGQHAVISLAQREDKCWWVGRWWIDKKSVQTARKTLELRWAPLDLKADKPLIWWWSD